jgi:hypothetical protein
VILVAQIAQEQQRIAQHAQDHLWSSIKSAILVLAYSLAPSVNSLTQRAKIARTVPQIAWVATQLQICVSFAIILQNGWMFLSMVSITLETLQSSTGTELARIHALNPWNSQRMKPPINSAYLVLANVLNVKVIERIAQSVMELATFLRVQLEVVWLIVELESLDRPQTTLV